ncbi:metabotropic glycine receptor isoform X1 [Tribolium castaneum]|uniref:Putative G-protein coupled receptor CG31760-like Protein n=1 Tax=Tribolium castaneum TaxID=7070 RepID=D6WL59_TRICA|nr:PREDICTED: probable G-protein coupled receptor 158 isoform X1 [Tribolium castaneum]XP_008193703.1 PREDICTED: probable G-protein coupled receptor 158 isoform X1 [Tribolium castaneum]XP_008193704.1 PREDICTED: probable G-protein coupled receptor 158 isoform X1 [Tribolium castaneum]XP_008193705.1 PREDICTED: probable G-protein coupled receptor 158 isoform X1 [Tribolium castaneum]EFA03503.2 putative G-protein coupled receptor CG31760-like Protein [Tribolium castaneum]|eukprot:XP_008193702.1 PREDICTED: probable G-protein coupled receptor 158 isoform X1 [Tribolium castaneum]
MNEAVVLLLFLTSVHAANDNEDCKIRFLSKPTAPSRLNLNVTAVTSSIFANRASDNFSDIARLTLTTHPEILGLVLKSPNEQILALNVAQRLRIFSNKTVENEAFWTGLGNQTQGWTPAFRVCHFLKGSWFYGFVATKSNLTTALFLNLQLDQCDDNLEEIFGKRHKCDQETTYCVPQPEENGGYSCFCRQGFFHPDASLSWKGFPGKDIENGITNATRCGPCPSKCDVCESNGICSARRDVYLKTAILSIQLGCMAITVIIALVVLKQRKTKSIASGMWTILETILVGIFILYCTVVVRFFEPSVVQCLLEPWAREVGFIICYGAIILKLYRHLIEFRTRKAHRWVVKDTDLLKYLLIMIMSVLAYMAAYTSITLNFLKENYSLLREEVTQDGVHYQACKPLWWDYVTETGELVILIFGIHLSYASRNARTQFHERSFLCAAISIELAVSTLFYVGRILLLPGLHPDFVLIIYCLRTQLSTSMTLMLVFIPKFWYQQKQVRSLAQEYSCRIPVDAFKDVNAHGPLTGNNSDVDVGEVTLADMSPDDIRAELKRLYLQLELFKSKTICRDNPHISKRRGGRKAQHRRFSLQKKGSREKNLHGKHRVQKQEETTEAEPSRTPEDSVCSNEGPSAIYSDLPSTAHTTDHK